MFRLSLLLLTALFTTSGAHAGTAQCCTATISLLDDVADAADCKTVNIEGFTTPASEAFDLDLADGATVNLSTETFYSAMRVGTSVHDPDTQSAEHWRLNLRRQLHCPENIIEADDDAYCIEVSYGDYSGKWDWPTLTATGGLQQHFEILLSLKACVLHAQY